MFAAKATEQDSGMTMRIVRIVGIGVLLASASSAALAFQEQQGAPAAGQSAASKDQGAGKELDLSADAPAGKQGTEVRIPGLGRLGVLPKMDFGLELLYGAAEPRPAEPPATSSSDDEELTIRGSLKHRF
jgi:hypothetical protein